MVHAAKGMARPFTVSEASSKTASQLPPADVTLKLLDYDFQASQPLKAGRQTIMVENVGPQAHEVVLLKLAPGKKTEDFAMWAEHGMKGPPPAQPLGGVTILDKGGPRLVHRRSDAGRLRFHLLLPRSEGRKAASCSRHDEELQGELTQWPRRKSLGRQSKPR